MRPILSNTIICPLLLVAFLLSGCAPLKGNFQTARDSSYNEKLGRVLIVPEDEELLSRVGPHFGGQFVGRLQELFSGANVASEVVRQAEGGLDENAPVRAAAVRFQPTQVLYFGVRRFTSEQYEWLVQTDVTMEFKLTEAKTGKTVWRTTAHYTYIPQGKSVADQLVQELKASGLL